MFNSSVSFREKSAWIALLATLVIFLPYFVRVMRLFERNELTTTTLLSLFLGAVILQITTVVVGEIIVAVLSKKEPRDERDLAIEAKSARVGYLILSAACGTAATCLILLAAAGPSRFLEPVFVSQVFLFCCVVAEASKQLTQLISYRRGI